MKTWVKPIEQLGACSYALVWAEKFDSLDEAWAKCGRGDWMLWLTGRLFDKQGSPEHKALVFAACQCARLALPYVSQGEERPRLAIEAAEAWTRGEATLAEVRKAAHVVDAMAHAAYAAHTVVAMAHTTDVVDAMAHKAYVARLKQCATIVRRYFPKPPNTTKEAN